MANSQRVVLAVLLHLAPAIGFDMPPPVRQKVDALPGVVGDLHYEFYSGFLDAGVPPSGRGKMYFHYICAMPPGWKAMPVSLWYNGGPGAPSTFGLFQEFGPYILSDTSFDGAFAKTGMPSPKFNPYTWANVTSLCEIDSPAPMGASFCTEGNGTAGSRGGPSGDAYSCGPWTDLSVAAADHQAHIAFFRDAFPEFVAGKNPVSIIGESYAGIYIPYFIEQWLNDPIPGVNLYGFAIGDGCTACIPIPGRPVNYCIDLFNEGFEYPNSLPGPWWDLQFFWGHSQLSTALYNQILGACTMDELKGVTPPNAWTPECTHLVTERMAAEVGYFYVYNLFESCPDEVPIASSRTAASVTSTSAATPASTSTSPSPLRPRRLAHRRVSLSGRRARAAAKAAAAGHAPSATASGAVAAAAAGGPIFRAPGDGDTGVGAACLTSSMEVYFGRNETLRAFGIPLDNNFIVLDNGIGMNYTINAPFVGPIYERAVAAGLRVLVYEGDSDASGLQTLPMEDVWVPFFGNGSGVWTPAGRLDRTDPHGRPLGLPLTQSWRPFGVLPAGRRVQGGYVMEWAGGQVQFVSIRGAGHLAPHYRPSASFTMMSAFQAGTSLPPGII